MKSSQVRPAVALLLGVYFSAVIPVVSAEKPINLLFIMTDQQRWDAMSCAGNTVLTTPNLDQLAAQGARFH
jgi:choline-sulfatase